MPTLLLRLASPLQSWGSDSNFDYSTTERELTKSAIIGFLGAALGWNRDMDFVCLSQQLEFGVRVDREGKYLNDFQTVDGDVQETVLKRPGYNNKQKYITYRQYLSDAVFLVGLEGERELLEKLEKALKAPVFPLYLGRRSCPPEGKLCLGIVDKNLRQALEQCPWQGRLRRTDPDQLECRLVLETDANQKPQYFLKDEVKSFSQLKREHTYRGVYETYATVQLRDSQEDRVSSDHDAFAAIGGTSCT